VIPAPGGLVEPCTAEKFKLAGLTASTGPEAGEGAFPFPLTLTVALADVVGSARLAALTTSVMSAVVAGAVSTPVALIEPDDTDHWTFLRTPFAAVATNCCVSPDDTEAIEGETEMLFDLDGVARAPWPHPEVIPTNRTTLKSKRKVKSRDIWSMTGSKSHVGRKYLENAFHSFHSVISSQPTYKARTLPRHVQNRRLFSKGLALIDEE
jgi:hypothetical protein